MKKTSKVFGAVALSAALALGTAVPAFAANPTPKPEQGTVNTGTTDDKQFNLLAAEDEEGAGPANTTVKVSTYVSQLNVTVPLYVAVAADVAGGAGMSPQNYYIENNSKTQITVVKVASERYSGANTLWEINTDKAVEATKKSDSGLASIALGYIDVAMTPIGTMDCSASTSNKGKTFADLVGTEPGKPYATYDNFKSALAKTDYTGASTYNLKANTNAAYATNSDTTSELKKWTIAAPSDLTTADANGTITKYGNKLYFELSTSSSELKREMKTGTGGDEAKLATVTYTIAAGDNSGLAGTVDDAKTALGE